MFAISFNGVVDEENTYDTPEEARRAIEEQVRDACREDMRDDCYSRAREASYWRAFKVVRIAH